LVNPKKCPSDFLGENPDLANVAGPLIAFFWDRRSNSVQPVGEIGIAWV
jgi:hypothetical protein